jgi:hypothetical protein
MYRDANDAREVHAKSENGCRARGDRTARTPYRGVQYFRTFQLDTISILDTVDRHRVQ